MKNNIPYLLIISRLFIGIAIVILSFYSFTFNKTVLVTLLIIGLLTDVFDGIIARRLQISTEKMRRWDSTVDQLFFTAVIFASYIKHPDFYQLHSTQIGILVALEILCYVVSFLKFKKEIATHSIGAKIWSLFLCAILIDVFIETQSQVLFELFFWIGILSRIEIIAIILILKSWTHDVPTFYHAICIRKGKAITRNKLFNG